MKKRYCQGAFLWVLDVMSGGREDSIGGSSVHGHREER
jgi:hypothetical protein